MAKILTFFSFNTAPTPWQLGFQEPATAMMSGIIDLHHDIMAILVFILGFVSVSLVTILFLFSEQNVAVLSYDRLKLDSLPRQHYHSGHGITHHTVLETVWTIIPTLILLVIATPSFALIYALDEIVTPELTVRITGRQWYWNYEYPDGFIQRRSFNYVMPTAGLTVAQLMMTIDARLNTDSTKVLFLPHDNPEASEKNNLVNIFPIPQAPFDILDWDYSPYFVWIMSATEKQFPWDYFASMSHGRFAGAPTFFNTSAIEDVSRAWLDFSYPVLKFNSYMIPTDDLPFGTFRLLEVDKRLVLPVNLNIRFLVTSDDVLHSWTVPSFGLKVDAVPGRTNEYYLKITKCGVYYGQCSEICGVNHGFMPIKVEVVPLELFRLWYLSSIVTEFDEDLDGDPVKVLYDKETFRQIVDEMLTYLCDFHGYSGREVHRQGVEAFYDGGFSVINFLFFRHQVAGLLWGIGEGAGDYTLKPTDVTKDFYVIELGKAAGIFERFNYSPEYVEKYRQADWSSQWWETRLLSSNK